MSVLQRFRYVILGYRLSVRVIGILLASVFVAVFCAALERQVPHYDPANWVLTQISVEDALSFSDEVLFVDARNQTDFVSLHSPGALSLSPDDWDSGLVSFLGAWTPSSTIVVYCGAQSCGLSKEVALRLLKDLPDAKIFVLKGGLPAWQQYQSIKFEHSNA